jgi:hypothetical protein
VVIFLLQLPGFGENHAQVIIYMYCCLKMPIFIDSFFQWVDFHKQFLKEDFTQTRISPTSPLKGPDHKNNSPIFAADSYINYQN